MIVAPPNKFVYAKCPTDGNLILLEIQLTGSEYSYTMKLLILVCLILIAVYCPSLDSLNSVILSTVNRSALTKLTLTCAGNGLRLVDGRTTVDVTCLEDGTWSGVLSGCDG
jgi:hypothetical protein